MAAEPIYACTVTQNRVASLKRLFTRTLPYVDKHIIIDGGSTDTTEDYCKSLAPKVEWYFREWDDSFSNQYNEFLSKMDDGWVCVLDTDELPDEDTMASIPQLVDESDNGEHYSVIEFRAHPISNGQDLGVSNYYRQLMVRWTPNLRYRCHLHQYLTGHQNGRVRRTDLRYFHIKPYGDEHRAACRNFWIGGIWPPGQGEDGIKEQEYQQLRTIVSIRQPEVRVFSDLAALMASGKIHNDIRRWIVYYRTKFLSHSLYNELRAYYDYYYGILHPQETPIQVDMTLTLADQLGDY